MGFSSGVSVFMSSFRTGYSGNDSTSTPHRSRSSGSPDGSTSSSGTGPRRRRRSSSGHHSSSRRDRYESDTPSRGHHGSVRPATANPTTYSNGSGRNSSVRFLFPGFSGKSTQTNDWGSVNACKRRGRDSSHASRRDADDEDLQHGNTSYRLGRSHTTRAASKRRGYCADDEESNYGGPSKTELRSAVKRSHATRAAGYEADVDHSSVGRSYSKRIDRNTVSRRYHGHAGKYAYETDDGLW